MLEQLRGLIDAGSQLVMRGNGNVLGQWSVLRATETSEKLIEDGSALKTLFKVDLQEYRP